MVTGLVAAADRGTAVDTGALALILVKAVAFLVTALVLGVWLSPKLFGLASRLRARMVLLAVGLAFCFALAWLGVAGATRFASLPSLVAAALAPVLAFLLTGSALHSVVLALIGALIAWRHRDNIRRLRAGTEGRIGNKTTG